MNWQIFTNRYPNKYRLKKGRYEGIRPSFCDSVLINNGAYGRIIWILLIGKKNKKQDFEYKEDVGMELILASFVQNLLKFACFILVAWAGILCGKKYKIHKQSKITEISTENKESK